MSLYGVQLDVATNRVIHNILMIFSCVDGCMNINTLDRLLHDIDEYGNKYISLSDIDECLKKVGIILKPFDLQAIGRYFGRTDNGMIDYHSFMDRLRYV